MTEKSVPPLSNPPSEKAVAVAPGTKDNFNPVGDVDRRARGVSKGGRERVRPVEALLKCLMCGRLQKVVFGYGKPPEWHRCIWCKELQPLDGYRVAGYGLNLPQPEAPHEVEARKRWQAEHP